MLKRGRQGGHQLPDTEAYREAVLLNAIIADELVQYALEVREAPVDRLFADDPEAAAYLSTEEGHTAVKRWVSAFKTSLSLVGAFRNQLVHSPTTVTDDDIAEAAQASDEMISALKERIARRAHAAA